MTGSEVVKVGTADEEEGDGGRQEEVAPWGGGRGCWDSGWEEEVHQKRSEEEASFLEATLEGQKVKKPFHSTLIRILD